MKNRTTEELLDLMNSCEINSKNDFSPYKRVHIENRPNLNQIQQAEDELKIKLPKSYIDFNTLSPWYWFGATCNFIVNPVPSLGNFFYGTICELNRGVREDSFYLNINEEGSFTYNRIPSFLIVVDSSNSIDDDYICFDTRFKDEYPVVYWSKRYAVHEMYQDKKINLQNLEWTDHPYFLYPNFSTFMYDKIKRALEFESIHFNRK